MQAFPTDFQALASSEASTQCSIAILHVYWDPAINSCSGGFNESLVVLKYFPRVNSWKNVVLLI